MAHYPAPTVVATAGSASANSYITRAEFQAYLGSKLHLSTAAHTASDDDLDRAVVTATRLMDAVMCWTGDAATEAQALNWPRSGMFSKNGVALSESVVPTTLKDAVAELAYQLLGTDLMATNQVTADGLKELQAGPVKLVFREGFDVLLLPTAVVNLLPTSWICEDWENSQTPTEYQNYEFTNVEYED